MITETDTKNERQENLKILDKYITDHHITDTERISFLRRCV